MYIVRWLIKHPIAGIWALTIIALFLSMSGEGNKTKIVSTDNINEQQTKAITSQKTVVPTQNETKVETKVEAKVEAKVAEKEVVTSETSNPVVTTASDSSNTAEINSKVEEHNTSAEGLDEQSTDDLLLMAREAYWNNGLDEAATIYQQLIQREPNVVTHKGELGNVYWKQGFPEKSAALYAEIALPMIKNGEAQRVVNMVGFIKLFHPNKATEINKQLQGLTKD